MAELPLPHFHVSGLNTLMTLLALVFAFGALHLLATSFPDKKLSQAWVGLGF